MSVHVLRRRALRGDTTLQRSRADLCPVIGLARPLSAMKWVVLYMGVHRSQRSASSPSTAGISVSGIVGAIAVRGRSARIVDQMPSAKVGVSQPA